MPIKAQLGKFLILTIWFLALVVEASVAWPVISLAIWLMLFNQVGQQWQNYLLLASALLLSVVWPMSMLLSLSLCILLLIMAKLAGKLSNQNSLLFLFISWLVFLPIHYYFQLTFSWFNLGQMLLSIVLLLLMRRFLLIKFRRGAVVFD